MTDFPTIDYRIDPKNRPSYKEPMPWTQEDEQAPKCANCGSTQRFHDHPQSEEYILCPDGWLDR